MNTTTEGNDNPYQATDVALEPHQSSKRRVIHSPFVLSVQWTVVLLCNSVVPLLIGWTEAQQGQGQFGIILAMGLCLVLGYVACIYIPLFALIATRGGFLVALTQFFPVLQLIAGMIAIDTIRKTGIIPGQTLDRGSLGLFDAFLVTVATGSILIGISVLFGMLLRLVTPERWWLTQKLSEQ